MNKLDLFSNLSNNPAELNKSTYYLVSDEKSLLHTFKVSSIKELKAQVKKFVEIYCEMTGACKFGTEVDVTWSEEGSGTNNYVLESAYRFSKKEGWEPIEDLYIRASKSSFITRDQETVGLDIDAEYSKLTDKYGSHSSADILTALSSYFTGNSYTDYEKCFSENPKVLSNRTTVGYGRFLESSFVVKDGNVFIKSQYSCKEGHCEHSKFLASWSEKELNTSAVKYLTDGYNTCQLCVINIGLWMGFRVGSFVKDTSTTASAMLSKLRDLDDLVGRGVKVNNFSDEQLAVILNKINFWEEVKDIVNPDMTVEEIKKVFTDIRKALHGGRLRSTGIGVSPREDGDLLYALTSGYTEPASGLPLHKTENAATSSLSPVSGPASEAFPDKPARRRKSLFD